jgi:hypothetical protein
LVAVPVKVSAVSDAPPAALAPDPEPAPDDEAEEDAPGHPRASSAVS